MRTKLFSLLLFLAVPSWLGAQYIADGVGYFPVVVIVTNEAGLPLQGVTVQLQDSGRRPSDDYSDSVRKRWLERIGQPTDTDASGAAVLFYYGGWASNKTKDEKVFSRSVRGKVVIDISGYERVERAVAEVTGGKNTSVSSDWAPIVHLTLKRKPPAEAKPK